MNHVSITPCHQYQVGVIKTFDFNIADFNSQTFCKTEAATTTTTTKKNKDRDNVRGGGCVSKDLNPTNVIRHDLTAV